MSPPPAGRMNFGASGGGNTIASFMVGSPVNLKRSVSQVSQRCRLGCATHRHDPPSERSTGRGGRIRPHSLPEYDPRCSAPLFPRKVLTMTIRSLLYLSYSLIRIRDAISKQERCTRTVGSNRHGHTAALCYPGPMGWTKTYKTVRRANLASTDRKPVRILPQMRRYTTFGTEVLRRLDEGVVNHKGLVVPVAGNGSGGAEGSAEELKKEARRVLYSFNDANRLPFARQCINKFGVKHLLDGL